MAISSDQETLNPSPNRQFSLRRRRPLDSSARPAFPIAETLTTDSVDDSSAGMNSDAERDRVDSSGLEEEKKKERCSVSNGGDGGTAPANFVLRASTPAHRGIKESPLSSDAIFKQSHAGLFNLCIVVLIAVNSRLIIENLMKYGLLIRAGFWFSSKSLRDWPLLMCCLSLPVFPLCAFMVEKLGWCKLLSESLVFSLHVIITTAEILYPVFMILRFDSAVLSGLALMLCASVVWLKLVSYAHTNYDLRALSNSLVKSMLDMLEALDAVHHLKHDGSLNMEHHDLGDNNYHI